jgi:hypothetical protein
LVTEGAPAVPASPGPVLAVGALAAFGTLVPFTLFAFGQSRVSAEVAGAFLNLEPLVGAIAGVAIFGNPLGPVQVGGGAAIVAGIGLSSLPLLAGGRRPRGRDQGDDNRGGGGRPTPGRRDGQPAGLREGQRGKQGQRAGNWLCRGEAKGPYTRGRDTPVSSGRCLHRDPVFR